MSTTPFTNPVNLSPSAKSKSLSPPPQLKRSTGVSSTPWDVLGNATTPLEVVFTPSNTETTGDRISFCRYDSDSDCESQPELAAADTPSPSSCNRTATTPKPVTDFLQARTSTVTTDSNNRRKRLRRATPILPEVLTSDGRLFTIPETHLKQSPFQLPAFTEADIERTPFQPSHPIGSPHQHTGLVDMPRIEIPRTTDSTIDQAPSTQHTHQTPWMDLLQKFLGHKQF